jgi:hypothetical protein
MRWIEAKPGVSLTSAERWMNILAVGDSFVPVPVFQRGLAGLGRPPDRISAAGRVAGAGGDRRRNLHPRISRHSGQLAARVGSAEILVVPAPRLPTRCSQPG